MRRTSTRISWTAMRGPRRTMNHLDQPRAADPRRRLIPWVGNPAFNYGNPSLSTPSSLLPSLIVPTNGCAMFPTIPTELNGAELEINAPPPRFFFQRWKRMSYSQGDQGSEKGWGRAFSRFRWILLVCY